MISVVVPVYNAEKMLKYCIDSILNQCYNNVELLLINDGSTDNSGALCDEYAQKDGRVKAVHQANAGVSAARNKGIELSSGEYICFVDSDDYIDREYFSQLLKLKEQAPQCDNIWCGFYTTSSYTGKDILEQAVLEPDISVSHTDRQHIMDLHKRRLDCGPYCKLYSAAVIKANGIRFPKGYSLGEDLIFNLEYLDHTDGRILILNKPLYFYVTDSQGSLTKKFHEDLFEKYKCLHAAMLEYLSRWNCDSKQLESFYESCFYIYDYVLRNTFKKDSSIKKKYQYNRQILKSDEFKDTMRNGNFYINPVMRLVLRYNFSMLYKLLFIR